MDQAAPPRHHLPEIVEHVHWLVDQRRRLLGMEPATWPWPQVHNWTWRERMEQVIEKCKFGSTPRGVCLTPDCKDPRSHLDTTGYCRACKIKQGIPVAPGRAPYGSQSGSGASSRRDPPTPTAVTPGQVLVDAGFIVALWEMLDTCERGAALELAWPGLRLETRVEILNAYMRAKKARAGETGPGAGTGGDR